jgi:hypothetical protein
MLVVPMPKRNRVRARARRPLETTARPERAELERSDRPLPRRSRSAVTGPVRATDAASPVLERAAAAERSYVMKDVRRLGLVAGVMLLLLIASGFAVSSLPQ